jgi:hypothetical protein
MSVSPTTQLSQNTQSTRVPQRNLYCVRLYTNGIGPLSVWNQSSGGKSKIEQWVKTCCTHLKFASFETFGLVVATQLWLEPWTIHSCDGFTLIFTISVASTLRLNTIRKFMQTHWLQHVLSRYPSIHTPFDTSRFTSLVDVDRVGTLCKLFKTPSKSPVVFQLEVRTTWALHEQAILAAGLTLEPMATHRSTNWRRAFTNISGGGYQLLPYNANK